MTASMTATTVIADTLLAGAGNISRALATSGDGLSGPQLLTNPDFETNITGWSAGAGCTPTRITSDHYSGAACARLVLAGASARYLRATLANVQPDLALLCTAYAKCVAGTYVAGTLQLLAADATTVLKSVAVTGSADWQQWQMTATPSDLAGNVTCYLQFIEAVDALNRTWLLDLVTAQPPGDSSLYVGAACAPSVSDGLASAAVWTDSNVSHGADTVGKFVSRGYTATATGGDVEHSFYRAGDAVVAGTPTWQSYYVRPGVTTWVLLGDDRDADYHMRWFNLSGAGTVGTKRGSTADTATITPGTGGHYWCTIYWTPTNSYTARFNVQPTTGDTVAHFTPAGTPETIHLDCVWSHFLPFPGDGATRAAGRLQAPVSLLNLANGAAMIRYRPGQAAGLAASYPTLLSLAIDATHYLELGNNPSSQLALYRFNGAEGNGNVVLANAWTVGTTRTAGAGWTPTTLAVDVNAGAWTSGAVAHVPTTPPATLDLGSSPVVGDNALNGQILWVALFSGPYTSIDRTKSYWTADADPVLSTIQADMPAAGAVAVIPCSDLGIIDVGLNASGAWSIAPLATGTVAVSAAT